MNRSVKHGMNLRNRLRNFEQALFASAICLFWLLAAGSATAQVSPGEIRNPKLSATEWQYLTQLQSLQLAIGRTQFPLPFLLTRYVGVDPSRQASLDTRGIEFVYFRNRMLLKTSGFYSAAFNAEELTANERASRVFEEVIAPILRQVAEQFASDVACEGIGFGIAYHTRAGHKNADFEGREILVVVLERAEAFELANEANDHARQAILNRSEIYLDGKPFGLALGKKDPIDLEVLRSFGPGEGGTASAITAAPRVSRLGNVSARFAPGGNGASGGVRGAAVAEPAATATEPPAATATPGDAEKMQEQYGPQLDALRKGSAQYHGVDYAPPSFAVYRKQLVLQFTLRNPRAFDTRASSIYKRAAQSFDLFLAPQLKALAAMVPADRRIDALDFSILNRGESEKDTSEAIEFICPVRAVQSFVEDEITTQEVIDQSEVLVSGVRIHLNLEGAE